MRKGFTLVEIMIVVLIIGILLAIAVPNWFRAREHSRARECVMTLRQIDAAKEFMAQEMNLPNGAACVMGDLWPTYIKRSTPPVCMAGGVYTVNVIGTNPTCSYVGGTTPHSIP